MGGEAERRLHLRHGPPPPQGKGDAVSRVWALSRQVLLTGRRLAGGSRGLGPWPGPPPSPGARHLCRRCPCAEPSHGSGSAFTMRQHCLQTVVPLPVQCCMPLECCSTASQDCSAASGLQQQCLWTAAALLLDSDTAFLLRQHCLQLVAAMPAHGSGIAFTVWQHCLQTVVPLPLQCCMPLECCSTASQHCSAASGLQQQCLWTAAALLLDSDTAFPMRQHGLQLVAYLHMTVALPSQCGSTAFKQWCHCL